MSDQNPTPIMRGGIVWTRQPSDFAARIELGDVGGFLNNEVVVEPGTNAIIIADGAIQGVVPPGRYMLSSMGDKLGYALALRQAKQVAAVVVDIGDVDMSFRVGQAYTQDPIGLTVDVNLVVQVPPGETGGRLRVVDFFMNVMKGRSRYLLADLKDHLQPEVENAVAEFIRGYTAADLNTDLRTKTLLEEAIRAHLDATLGREGFSFKGVRAVRIFHERLNAQTQRQEELLLQTTEQQAEVQGRQRLFDVTTQRDRQDIADYTQQVMVFEQRAVLNERMRKAVASDKMDEVRSEAEFETFMDGVDRGRMLRAEERAKLAADYQAARGDREQARAHLLARLDIEQRYELLSLEEARKRELTHQQFQAQQTTIRQQLDQEMSTALMKAQGEMTVQRARADFERDQARLATVEMRTKMLEDARAGSDRTTIELDVKIRQAKTDVEISALAAQKLAIEREQDRLDAELGISLLDRMKAVRRQDEKERDLHALEMKQRDLEIELTRRRAETDLKLTQLRGESDIRVAERKLELDHELARIDKMGALPPEALIALSPVDQARVIAELRQTDAYKSMSGEQLMALMAAKSPDVARALTEKYKAEAVNNTLNADQKALYERLVTAQAESGKTATSDMKEAMRMQQETALKMAEMMRDVGLSRPGSATTTPPIIVVGGGSGGPISSPSPIQPSASGEREVSVCPKCQHKSPIGVKFCSNCGYKFYD